MQIFCLLILLSFFHNFKFHTISKLDSEGDHPEQGDASLFEEKRKEKRLFWLCIRLIVFRSYFSLHCPSSPNQQNAQHGATASWPNCLVATLLATTTSDEVWKARRRLPAAARWCGCSDGAPGRWRVLPKKRRRASRCDRVDNSVTRRLLASRRCGGEPANRVAGQADSSCSVETAGGCGGCSYRDGTLVDPTAGGRA